MGTPDFPAPPPEQGIQLASRATILPGREQVDCRYLVLPDQPIEVARFEHQFTPGAHHVLLYPTSLSSDEIEEGQTFDCTSRGELHATGIAYGGSEPEGELPYPEGIAMRLPAGAVMLLESHYLNSTTEPLDAEIRINLWYTREPASIEAGTIFYYNWHILLPPAPGQASTAMRCRVPQDLSLLYATSHMHRRGVGFQSRLLRNGEEPRSLHESQRWAAPTPDVFWPPLQLRAGDTVEFGCSYQNDLAHEVIEGPSAEENEMCVFIAGYWPKMNNDHELCIAEGDAPVLRGSRTCEQTVDCMLEASSGDWVEGQRCIADTCEGSAEALSSFVVCVERHDCWGSETCVAQHCLDAWTGCMAADC